MLEQEWCFLASNTPYDAYMNQRTNFEGVDESGIVAVDYFNPIVQCSWKLHLVTLPRYLFIITTTIILLSLINNLSFVS
jgi:hypothetical protein